VGASFGLLRVRARRRNDRCGLVRRTNKHVLAIVNLGEGKLKVAHRDPTNATLAAGRGDPPAARPSTPPQTALRVRVLIAFERVLHLAAHGSAGCRILIQQTTTSRRSGGRRPGTICGTRTTTVAVANGRGRVIDAKLYSPVPGWCRAGSAGRGWFCAAAQRGSRCVASTLAWVTSVRVIGDPWPCSTWALKLDGTAWPAGVAVRVRGDRQGA